MRRKRVGRGRGGALLWLLVFILQTTLAKTEDPARLVVRPDPSTVTENSAVSFFCRSDGNPLPNVQWKVNGKSSHDSRFVTRSLPNGLSTLRIEPVTLADNATLIACAADNGVASPVYAEAILTVLTKQESPAGFPVIEAHPSLKSVEQGRTAHVTCRVQGNPRPKVLWLRDLVPIDIRSESRYSVSTIGNPGALMIQNAREEDQGKYECVARNELGVTHSKAAHLYVKVRRVPPYFSYKLEKQYKVLAGGNVNLTCIAVGYPMPRVFWKKSDDVFLDDPHTAPIGKNVLTLSSVDRSENFTCVAVSKLGNIETTTTVLVKALPPAPTNVFVDGVTASSVTLKWDEVHLTDGERVNKFLVKYRQKAPYTPPSMAPQEYVDSNSFRTKEVSAEMNKITIGELEPYTLYEFVVFTVNDIGPGSGSQPREAQTAETAPGQPPLKVQARAMNRGSIYITWSPSEQPNGEITGYRILYTNKDKSTPTQTWESKEFSGQPPAQIYNLELDSTYYIHLQARNRKGLSPVSNLATVVTTQGIPGQPQSLSAKALDSRRIQLQWERPLYVQPVTRYVIWMNSTDGEKELTLTSPSEKYVMTGLEPNSFYAFKVAAESQRGRGPFCEETVAKTQASTPAGAPTIRSISTVSSSILRINWTEPDKGLQNGNLVRYRINWRPVQSENSSSEISDSYEDYSAEDQPSKSPPKWESATVNAPETFYSLENLQYYTVYEVTVAAATEKGFGPESDPVRKRTAEDVPSAPRNLSVRLTNANEVKLSWDPPQSSNGQLRGYYVYKEQLLNGVPVHDKLQKVSLIQDPKKTETIVENLKPNTEYAFRVNAFNRNGDGEFSESQTIVTGGLPPRAPEIISVVLDPKDPEELPVKAKIVWKAPELGPLESPIDRYNVWYRPEGKPFKKQLVNGTEHDTTINGLWLGRVYELVVGAESVDGQSQNATEQLVTPIGLPDAEPTNVQYEIVEGKMRISWEPPVEEKRNGNITSYRAVLTPMDSSGQRMDKEVSGDERSAIFPVEPRKSYTFKVSASTMKGAGPFSPVLTINPDPASLVGPPTNVRVQATSNSSAVVQWDFEGEQVDGFVVKYMHEPRGKMDTDRWTARTVMSPSSRYLEIGQLTAHKPYAFCVLAIRQNRQGSCSDPPTALQSLTPTHMVKNLQVVWKTSNSVKLSWEYDPPGTFVGFYLNHTGKKEYMDQQLAVKTMTTPGFKQDLSPDARDFLWTNLRPHMRYTFHVGVRGQPPSKTYWPMEVVVITDPTGPPLVATPRLSNPPHFPRPGQVNVQLTPASEEYGPVSHYWVIIVPANVSQELVVNMDPHHLERATNERRVQMARQISATPTKKVKKSVSFSEEVTTHVYPSYRGKRHSPTDGVYVSARISADSMRALHANNQEFTVGDEKMYEGFTNFPLEPNSKYRVMMRAFAQDHKGNKWEQRPPMSEKTVRLYTDSAPSDAFITPSSLTKSIKPSNVWLVGPLIALMIIAILIGMLVCWWLRCNRKSAGHGAHRHGSITKVALGGPISGMPSETSKLLQSDSYGRTIMNPYEQLNGAPSQHPSHMESTLDLYPLPNGRSMQMNGGMNGTLGNGNYAPVPVQVPCLPSSGGLVGGHSLSHPAIPIAELSSHIERLRMNNNMGFQQEFESIETGQHFTWENSNLDCNKHKNRYANVVAYDHSRVVLSSIDGMPGADYINANYIDGYEKPKGYIATQGPLPETFEAFWRMVWEEGSVTIVMLTNLEERSRVKCDQYWPSRGSAQYGDVQVTLVETSVLAHYTMRTMRIQMIGENEIREIRHLQYTAWPDHGVPDHPTPFLVFLKRVRILNPPDAGPIISHCSAGIGRTGAFIVIDCMLERLRYENTVDIYGCVTALRSQRSYMVQTEDQYVFIHDAVLDAVNSGSTEVPANKLYQHVQALTHNQTMENGSGIDMEFRHLSTMKTLNSKTIVANLPINRAKNRQNSQAPYDSNRVILQMIPGVEGSDYINASWVDGYRERCAYIAAQGPLVETMADFWRMVWESDAAIVVMLTKIVEQGREKCCEYWPMESGAQLGNLVVEPIAEYNMTVYILREFRLSDIQSGMSRTVRHFQFVEWPELGAPKLAENFIDFVQQVHRTKSQFGIDGPIVVHCSNGAARTGVFMALAILIDRMQCEQVVDVFTTVKLLRTERAGMVQDKDHYHFLYQAALEFLSCYEQYAS